MKKYREKQNSEQASVRRKKVTGFSASGARCIFIKEEKQAGEDQLTAVSNLPIMGIVGNGGNGMARRRSTADKGGSKRDHILAAAAEIFSKKGYFRTTVDEIIAKADTGKGTVYNYFSNKEQLFYTLIQEKNTPFLQELELIAVSERHAFDKIKAVVRAYLIFYTENADLWRVLMHEMRGLDGDERFTEEERDRYRQEFHSAVDILRRILEMGMQEGVIKPGDSNRSAYGLFSVVLSMVFQGLARENVDETALAVVDVFFNGVAVKRTNK